MCMSVSKATAHTGMHVQEHSRLRPTLHGPASPCMAEAADWCLRRVASNAAENEMDAHALALSLAPCVAWHAPPQSERRRVSQPCSHSCAC